MWHTGIYGQKHAIQLLSEAISKDMLSQSFIFYGPSGVGRRLMALKLAMAVQCDEGLGVGCGVCRSCQKLIRDTHADWHFVEPEGTGIRIDQVRELQQILARRPFEGRRRIAVLDPADKMNDPAANALLKLLEEPAPDSLIILICNNLQRLLPTIRSRCQLVRFSALSFDDLAATLPESIAEPQRSLLLRLCGGSMGKLKALQDDNEWQERRLRHIDWYFGEPSWNTLQRLDFAKERDIEWRDREPWQELWSQWQSLSRDLLGLSLGMSSRHLLNPDVEGLLKSMPVLPQKSMVKRIEQLEDAHRQIQANTSPRLVAESLLLSFERQ